VPEILDRDLSRPDRVRLLLSFARTAMMMLATGEKENSEEKRDAATHSLFFERISAESGTGGQRRQRCQRRDRRELGALPRLRGRGEQCRLTRRSRTAELDRRHSCCPPECAGKGAVRVRRLRLSIELESHLTKSLSTPVASDQWRELVLSDAESDLMDFRPEQVNGHCRTANHHLSPLTNHVSLLTFISLRYFTNAFFFSAENPWASKKACACDRELWLCSMIFEQSAR
jgi:hypothetical protein